MARIIKHSERITITDYSRYFEWRTGSGEGSGAGFSFDCTQDGTILNLPPRGLDNYRKCLDGTYDVVDKGIVTWTRTYTDPAVLRCDCGSTVELDGFTNTCRCGADYNMSGQHLAPRCLWGDDTGETPDEILSYR